MNMKRFATAVLLALSGLASTSALAAPVIKAIFTSYGSTGTPLSISVSGTGFCGSPCATPTITLGSATLRVTAFNATLVTASLAGMAEGDYPLVFTAGKLGSVTYPLRVAASASAAASGATVSIGTTSTLPSGSPATVSNVGTKSAAILNFGLPAGPKGDVGVQGPIGLQGPMGLQGVKGDQGDVGPVGPTGPKGDSGVQGPKGDTGLDGPRYVAVDRNGLEIGDYLGAPTLYQSGALNWGTVVMTSGTAFGALAFRTLGFGNVLAGAVYYESIDCTGPAYISGIYDGSESVFPRVVLVTPPYPALTTNTLSGSGLKGYIIPAGVNPTTSIDVRSYSYTGSDCTGAINLGRPAVWPIQGVVDLGQFVPPFSVIRR